MSAPSSEGRLSTSSMPSVTSSIPAVTSSLPSVTSSPTLNSRYSGVYADSGEGSSSQRPSLADSRSGGRSHVQEEPSQHSGRALRDEAVGERDFAQRKRNRRSGGFLLDSAFSSGPQSRHSHQSGNGKDAKRKQSDGRSAHGERHAATGIASGSPLSREVKMAGGAHAAAAAEADGRVDSVDTDEHASDGIHLAKTRARLSAVPPTAHDRVQPDATAPRPAFDPNQIVHMALSLNESRRRNLSAGQLLTPQTHATSGRRRDGSVNSPSTGSGHLRQYLNEQRRVSRNISPFSDKSPARHMSMPAQRRASVLIQGQQGKEPSSATWQRADKARAFIELRVEYLRLLEFLPPLKPDSSAPANFVVMANNVPGSPHAQLTRIPSHANKHHELGRPYNPLQVLRNRRSRARERRAFEHAPEEFADVDQVHKWVDRVEEAAQSFMYRRLDQVALPRLHEADATDVDPAKSARPSKIWMLTPEELLADAHWLEHGDNKTIVEDRYGRKIFPAKEPQKQDLLSARPSKEYSEKRRRSWVEGIVAENHNTTGDESEALSERGRKRRLLPKFRAESPKHKKHNWIGSKQQAGSDTDFSDSDSDLEKRRSKKTQKMVEGVDETGALKLRMKHLMEREAKEKQTAETPLLFTPDTPNKWGQETDDGHDEKGVRSSFEVSDSANGSVKANLAGLNLPPKQRNDPELLKDPSKEYRSSFEEFDSTAPSTPLYPRHYPHIDGDTSPTVSRAGSHKKSKKSKLDFLRSEESKGRHDQDHLMPDLAGSDKKRSSRHASEGAEEGNGIGSAIWAAPGAVKNFLGHRKNDSVNSLTSPIKDKDRRDMKEPPSAVTRFIKGVKNEGSKMGGFIFRKDGPADESDTDAASDHPVALESETDDELGSLRRRKAPNLTRSSTTETVGSTTSKTSKKATGYHLELPSFRSQSKIDEDSASELSDNHISRQARETARKRSPRFDKLAPPGLDLSRISSSTRSPSDDRISQLLARLGGVGHAGLPVTSLAKDRLPPSSTDINPIRKSSRPTLEGKRHWSITDSQKDLPRSNSSDTIEVTPSEIARVRALYLCSGIKAKEINRRALEIRNPPADFLVRAATSAHRDLYPVARKEEHVLAARILTTAFESRIAALQSLARSFREDTVVDLQSRIADLVGSAETSLFARVRDGADEALRVSSKVTADAPLAAKQIADDMEHMVRMRRRRTRWARRVGWTLLEWALLGFMWCAWLVVTLSRVGARCVLFFWHLLRWLLWL
ncbi:hypothetical protein PMIN07_001563 [Paraphaeosphaeria minitans]